MPGIGSSAISALQQAMRFRVARESVLAANVANADTPNYRRRDLSFDGVLQRQNGRLARTDPGHLPQARVGPEGARVETGPRGDRPDGNGVDLDRELMEVHRNSGAFIDQANVLARFSTLLRTAIGQG